MSRFSNPPNFVKNAFYVGDGNIFFANDVEALKETVENKRNGSVAPLSELSKYQTVSSYIHKFNGTGHSLQVYSSNHNGLRTNYNLYRTGKLLEGDTILSKILQRIYPDKNVESSVLDNGSKLPPFESFEDRMGASGAYGKNEPDGFFIKGFGLSADQLP